MSNTGTGGNERGEGKHGGDRSEPAARGEIRSTAR